MHPYFTPDAIARFWSKVDRSGGPDACWLWTACVQHKYGIFRFAYKNWKAHRVAYELTYGPVPEGNLACHSCDTPLCCNPAHLWAGEPADNSADMVQKGRSARGEQVSLARLTADQVREIRRRLADGERQGDLARIFGIHKATMHEIAHRVTWKHVT